MAKRRGEVRRSEIRPLDSADASGLIQFCIIRGRGLEQFKTPNLINFLLSKK